MRKMNPRNLCLCVAIAALLWPAVIAFGSTVHDPVFVTADHWNDSRSVDGDGVDTEPPGNAFFKNFSIGWDISFDATTLIWTYNYTFSGEKLEEGDGVSHFILEVSPTFTQANILSIDSDDIDQEELEPRNDHPFPGPNGVQFRGIKFETESGDDLPLSLTFTTTRSPIWGDFTVKKAQAFAYNTGIGTQPPIAGVDRDDFLAWIPTPDTLEDPMVPIPLPAAAPAALGLIWMWGLVRRRRSASARSATV